MDEIALKALLDRIAAGELAPQAALEQLRRLPFSGLGGNAQGFEDLGFARVDHHRRLRQGTAEVILGRGKTPEQVAAIAAAIAAHSANLLVTRADAAMFTAVAAALPAAEYHPIAEAITLVREPPAPGQGTVLVISAGTSDMRVAEEAALTAALFGGPVEKLYDCGVAGLHRLLAEIERIQRARVIVVVAGMEGALPSVVGGLVGVPVIAVPTSVGYGSSFGGLAALLGMLNSCASNVCVVNIDNGFGAGYIAATVNRLR